MRNLTACLVLAVLPLLALGPVCAYPTSLNIIPTADPMARGDVRLEVEWDGATTPLGTGGSVGTYLQVGVTDRLEVGLDVLDLNHRADWQFNLKVLVQAESASCPAIAVGLMDVGDAPLANAYLVMSRQVGPVRVHAGLSRTAGTQGLFGLEYYWDDLTGGLLDWTTGPEGYATVGLYRDLGRSLYGVLYYARGNARGADDFVGLDIYTEFAW